MTVGSSSKSFRVLITFMRVATLVFFFLIRLRFPHSKKIWNGQETVKKLRKLEKLNYRYGSPKLLVNCNSDSVVPKFLNFRVATNSLKSSRTYQQCQLSLLHE